MKKDELRKVPVKNYVILGVVIVVTVLILYYFYLWVDVYKESKINIPIMDKYMTVINYNEFGNIIDRYICKNVNKKYSYIWKDNDKNKEYNIYVIRLT